MKTNCPYCAERIQSQALKCKHCGEWVKERSATEPQSVESQPSPKDLNPAIYFLVRGRVALTTVLVFVLFGAPFACYFLTGQGYFPGLNKLIKAYIILIVAAVVLLGKYNAWAINKEKQQAEVTHS